MPVPMQTTRMWTADTAPLGPLVRPLPMLLRIMLLLILAMGSHMAHGQLRERIIRILNGDSLAPPDHDTTYVTTYRSNLTVSAVSRYQFVDVDLLRGDGDALSFSSNTNEQYGVGLSYKWLSAELTFDVPFLSSSDPALGPTESRGFGLGYTGRRLWARTFINATTGFHLEDPERWVAGHRPGDATITRPDLNTITWLLSVNYALSGKKRYSHNAALFQEERQKRSAGTFVAGVLGWLSVVQADSSLLPRTLLDTFGLASGPTRVERALAGFTFGYTHTFSFREKVFFHLGLQPGLAYMKQNLFFEGMDPMADRNAAFIMEMKTGTGYNGDRWYASITASYFLSNARLADDLSLGANHGFTRLAAGLRFGGPKIKLLRKVGL